MKIAGNKKTAIVILLVFVSLLSILLLFVFIQMNSKNYPEEPLLMKSMGSSDKNLDISGLKRENKVKEIPVFYIEPKIQIDLVEKMIDEMGLSLNRNVIVENMYIEWSDEDNSFTYNALLGTVSFELTRRITLERGEKAFTNIFKRYLGKDYTFNLVKENRFPDGSTVYYASRIVEEDLPIEFAAAYEYSDFLIFNQGGYLQAGQLLLINIDKYDLYLPLISQSDLEKYVNTRIYPKDHVVDTSILGDTLDLDYIADEWSEIEDSIFDCKAIDQTLILLFSNTDQGYLLPAFKVSSTCKTIYEDNEYSVPAIFYLNAADPSYITR
jgi:hypothetical protein